MGDIDLRAFGGLERDVKHLTERIDDLEAKIETLEARISQLIAILDQARGVKIFLGLVIAAASFVLGTFAAAKGLFR